jgi:hypothetical protein
MSFWPNLAVQKTHHLEEQCEVVHFSKGLSLWDVFWQALSSTDLHQETALE